MSIKNPQTPSGIEPATFGFVAQHLTTVLLNTKVIIVCVKKKVNQSHYTPEVPRGFQEVKFLRFYDVTG